MELNHIDPLACRITDQVEGTVTETLNQRLGLLPVMCNKATYWIATFLHSGAEDDH